MSKRTLGIRFVIKKPISIVEISAVLIYFNESGLKPEPDCVINKPSIKAIIKQAKQKGI